MLPDHARKGMIAAVIGSCLAGILILVPALVSFSLKLIPSKPPAALAAAPMAKAVPAPDSVAETPPEDGRFGLAKEVYTATKSVGRPAEAKALAGAFSQTAEKVRQEDPSIWSILSWIKSASDEAIPDSSQETWADLQNKLSARLTSLYGSGQLASASDWADCFEEIARGLEAAGRPVTL